MNSKIPAGFLACKPDETFNDVAGPLYIKPNDGGQPSLGFLAEKKHCNFVGMVHGGCLMTFTDIALQGAVCEALGKYTSTPTISMNLSFVSAAKEGQWVEAHIIELTMKRTMAFITAAIKADDKTVATVSATFSLPQDLDKFPGLSPEEYLAYRIDS